MVKNFLEGEEKDIAKLFNLLKDNSKSNDPEEIFNIFINSYNSSKSEESIVKYNDIVDKNKAKEESLPKIVNENKEKALSKIVIENKKIIKDFKDNCSQSNQFFNQKKLKNEQIQI